MKSLNKTETPIFFCSVFFVSKGNFLDFCFTSLQLVFSAVERLPVFLHIVQIIFLFPLGSLDPL